MAGIRGMLLGLGILAAAAIPGGAVTAGDDTPAGQEREPLAVLISELAYCQVKAIDGKERRLAEDQWAFVAGSHQVHFECTAATNKTQVRDSGLGGSVSIRRSWIFDRDLAFTPEAGGRYLARDFVDASEREFVWIERADTGAVVSGARPRALEDFAPRSAAELLEARKALGTGSTLVVDYKAPKKPVRRFTVEIQKQVVVESSGNEDLRLELEIAPGFYPVKVTVANSEDVTDYGARLDLDLEEGQTRTLRVKGKAWGRSAIRLK